MPSFGLALRGSLLFEFDDRCHYCGEKGPETLDHIVPRCVGGPSLRWNLVPACGGCNRFKDDLRAVCPCDRCIEAETLFLGYQLIPRDRPKPKTKKPVVKSPVVVMDQWRLSKMAHCNHVVKPDTVHCAKCGAYMPWESKGETGWLGQ